MNEKILLLILLIIACRNSDDSITSPLLSGEDVLQVSQFYSADSSIKSHGDSTLVYAVLQSKNSGSLDSVSVQISAEQGSIDGDTQSQTLACDDDGNVQFLYFSSESPGTDTIFLEVAGLRDSLQIEITAREFHLSLDIETQNLFSDGQRSLCFETLCWALDFNNDSQINISDLVFLIEIIMDFQGGFLRFLTLSIVLLSFALAAVHLVPDDFATIQEAVDAAANADTVSVASDGTIIPMTRKNSTSRNRITPNPFNSTCAIQFNLPKTGIVSADIYDLKGHKLENLINGMRSKGLIELHWNANSFPSGIYFLHVQSENLNIKEKLLYVK